MHLEVLFPLVVLFIAQGVPSYAQSSEAVAAVAAEAASTAAPGAGRPRPATRELLYYDVGRPFALNCSLPRPDASVPYVWWKNESLVSEAWDVRDRFKREGSTLQTEGRSVEDDFGEYTCVVGAAAQGWELRGHPVAKLPPNTNAVEGQKVNLVCKVVGKPYPAVTWTFNNASEGESNGTAALEALGADANVTTAAGGAAGGVLVLEAAARRHAGEYKCVPAGAPANATATTRLRVKGMYAALWPFLGICAEVFVLCAIILVYEKRRTKPELDDSDTDNHDQKKS